MGKLEEAKKAIAELSPAERVQLAESLTRGRQSVSFGIESNLAVCGGEACIARTRIPVWLLVQATRLGSSEAELLRAYPTLRAADLVNAWAYAESHEDEINRDILANEDAN